MSGSKTGNPKGEAARAKMSNLAWELGRLCDHARAAGAEVEAANQGRGGFGWAQGGGSRPDRDPRVEAFWGEKADASQASAEALADFAAEAVEAGLMDRARSALKKEFEKSGTLPCDLVARRMVRGLGELARRDSSEAARAAQEWAGDEAFWSAMSWADFGAATRGLWGKKAPRSTEAGEGRSAWGKPLAELLALGAQSEELALGAIGLARRAVEFLERADPAMRAWEELARGATNLSNPELEWGPGLDAALSDLPLPYWLSLREWVWARREELGASALIERALQAALARAGEPEAAPALSKHLWMSLDKEGLSRWEALKDGAALAHVGRWWSAPGPDELLEGQYRWSGNLASASGAWARPAFEAAGLPASARAEMLAWPRDGFEKRALTALHGAYAALQAEWVSLSAPSAGSEAKRSPRGL